MTDHALEVTGLRKTYKGFALDNVSFTLPRGCVMGLIGPNGAGKTTIIKLIMNLVTRQAGEIKVFGLDNLRDEVAVKSRIGFVYDVPPFLEDTTLERHRRAVARFYPSWNDATFARLAREFELPLDRKVKALSQGMRTKFALALALSHDADLLVLDEPTSGLDPVFRRELLQRFGALLHDERKSILFSTHITSDLERVADYVTLVRNGRVAFSLTADEIRENWGVVKGSEALVTQLAAGTRHGLRRGPYGVEVLTSDVADARRRCAGSETIIDRASLEDIMVLMAQEGRHAA
jgi:ABC-2 type transport system ATP-binding protein